MSKELDLTDVKPFSVRDQLACSALHGLLANSTKAFSDKGLQLLSEQAYAIADKMLRVRG